MSSYNAKSIVVLEGLEPVRERPGMYIGSTSVKGLNHLVYEIVDNSVDEHLAGYCMNIHVTLNKDDSVTVEDDGRGIPVDMHQKGFPAERVIMTTLHAGGKFDNNSYKTSGGLHGVGSSVVNALSSKMIVDVRRDGKIYHDEYAFGKPAINLSVGQDLPIIGKCKTNGTIITFYPDSSIFETIHFKASAISQRLHETAYLNPKLTLTFENKRDGEQEVVYHEPNGITAFMDELTKETENLTEIITFSSEREGISVEGAFRFTQQYGDSVIGFCNNINTVEGGTHITGFKSGFARVVNQYAHTLGNIKDKDQNFIGNDTRNGMVAVISIKHPTPRYEGQTKTKLDNPDAANAVAYVLNTELQLYFDRHLDTLKTIIACAERAAKIRKSEEKIRTNLSDKKFAFEGNGKLAKQESNDASKCEIFIVEGDSAGGTAKTARNRMFQAIMPIRGKILNVEKQSMEKVLDNAEIKAMINAFGCGFSNGYGNDFNIDSLKYDKIVIMTDADVDGAHISTLLLTFFYRFMPELLYAGKVYRAMPPLYKVTPFNKKQQPCYLYDDTALDEYTKKYGTNYKLQRYKGLGEMSSDQLWETTLNPATRQLKKIEIDDAITADSITSILMGNDVTPRKSFIIKKAREASIDI
jgi:DNA gyrase subunit B